MNGRHELKYFINASELAQLRARLRVAAKPDANAAEGAGYTVRSLYFDNYSDKAVFEKQSGQSRREKFRLRYYNGDTSFIRLEKKSKANMLAYKETAAISAGDCAELLAGNRECLRRYGDPLFAELYAKMAYQCLRPKTIVDYHREAYVCRAGGVRVTFDTRVRVSDGASGFLKPGTARIPAAGPIVMEVKYGGFLPDFMRDILQIGRHNRTEFSKYAASRLR